MGSFFIDPASLSTSFYGNVQLVELFVAYAYLLWVCPRAHAFFFGGAARVPAGTSGAT